MLDANKNTKWLGLIRKNVVSKLMKTRQVKFSVKDLATRWFDCHKIDEQIWRNQNFFVN